MFLFFGNKIFSQKTNLAGAFIVPEPPALWGGMKSRVGKYFKGRGRGRKGENGKEGHWQKLLLVFLLMCVKYFENIKKKKFAAFGCRSYVFPLINSIEPIQFSITVFEYILVES